MKSKTLLRGLEMLSLPVKECKLWPGSVLFCWGVFVAWSQPCHRRVVNWGCPVMCLCEP